MVPLFCLVPSGDCGLLLAPFSVVEAQACSAGLTPRNPLRVMRRPFEVGMLEFLRSVSIVCVIEVPFYVKVRNV